MYYRYSVLSDTGNEINGVEEGSFFEVKERLTDKNYYILSIEPDILKSIKASFGKKKIKPQALSIFFEDMVNMLKTGISINEAVIALGESSTDSILTKALSSIDDSLAKGFSLTEAFGKTKVFPELVLNMLKVGEKSGNLEEVFKDLALYYLREADFLRSLKNAVIYPAVVFSLLVAIMFYVSFKVIPHLEMLLPIRGSAYFATRALLSLTHFLKGYWYICLLFPIALVFIFSRFKAGSAERIADYYYRLPVIGQVMKDIAFSTFFSNLAVLQRNGISVIDGLNIIKEASSYKFLAKKVLKIRDFITSGLSFWQALEKDTFFPAFVYYAVRKGEEMGKLDDYLAGLSKYYFDKVTRRVGVILSFIQPLLLIFCAVILLFIVSAFIMPVYSNLSNIAGGNLKF